MKPIPIKEFSHYLVDEKGNVYSTLTSAKTIRKEPRLRKSYVSNSGYPQVVLQNKAIGVKPTALYVHRLVAAAYIPNPNNLPEVNHKNLNKQDNRVENLEWVTRQENCNHQKNHYGIDRPVFNKVLSHKRKIEIGINIYLNERDTNKIAELWGCNKGMVMEILRLNGIETNNHKKIPYHVEQHIKREFEIQGNLSVKKKWVYKIQERCLQLYNYEPTMHHFWGIRRELQKKITKKARQA